jgi:hypothetical protein
LLNVKRPTAHESQQLLSHIPLESYVYLQPSFDERLYARLREWLLYTFLESVPGLLPRSDRREAGVLVNKLLSRSNSKMVPARNTAGELVDKVFELIIWDRTINPFLI